MQLQRPSDTRWQSQLLAGVALFKAQTAMEKAAVDAEFKKECLRAGSAERKKAAGDST